MTTEAASVPMERALGPVLGTICAELHADHGVDLRLGIGVESFAHNGTRVTGVVPSILRPPVLWNADRLGVTQ